MCTDALTNNNLEVVSKTEHALTEFIKNIFTIRIYSCTIYIYSYIFVLLFVFLLLRIAKAYGVISSLRYVLDAYLIFVVSLQLNCKYLCYFCLVSIFSLDIELRNFITNDICTDNVLP